MIVTYFLLINLWQSLLALPVMETWSAPSVLQTGYQEETAWLVHRETITRTLNFPAQNEANELMLKNVQGAVKVQAYDGQAIKIVVEKTIEARNPQDLQRGIEEIQLSTKTDDTMLYAYLDAPFVQASFSRGKIRYNMSRHDDSYSFRMDFTVQVPRHLNLDVSTVNEGDLLIEGVQAAHIKAQHLNGRIECKDISGQTTASTVNGDVYISYRQTPSSDNEFKTVNGSITLLAPKNLSADVSFESMHGDFYTNYEPLQYLPARVQKNQTSKGTKSTYRMDQRTLVRIGQGGSLLRMETLNGEAYLKYDEP